MFWIAPKVKFCSYSQGNKWRDGNLVNVEWELTVFLHVWHLSLKRFYPGNSVVYDYDRWMGKPIRFLSWDVVVVVLWFWMTPTTGNRQPFFEIYFLLEKPCHRVTDLATTRKQSLIFHCHRTFCFIKVTMRSVLSMGREIYLFKTGFTKSQRADSARADGPGILTFFQLILNAHCGRKRLP